MEEVVLVRCSEDVGILVFAVKNYRRVCIGK